VIKRGEHSSVKELQNEYAGRLLLAVYGREPWSCHQKYRIFGDLENKIFGYETDAPRIRFVQLMDDVVGEELAKANIERIRKYSLTRFLILHFVAEILRRESDGEMMLGAPKPYLSTRSIKSDKESKIMQSLKDCVDFVITELNFIFEDRGGENYDYKTEFKSPHDVNAIGSELVKAYVKDKRRDRIEPFALPE
jgi:hypothetical protein